MSGKTNEKLWLGFIRAGNEEYARRRVARAEQMFEKALEQAEKFGETDERYALSLNNLAAIYHVEGKYQMALEHYEKSLKIKERVHGKEHPDVALNLQNIAAVHSAKGRYEDAEPLYKRSIQIREKLLGEDHPDLVTALENYANLLRRTEREKEAEQIEVRVKEITSKKAETESAKS